MADRDSRGLDDRARSLVTELAHAALAQVLRRRVSISREKVGVARGGGLQVVVYAGPYAAWTLTEGEAAALFAQVAALGRESTAVSGRAAELSGARQDRDLTPTELAILQTATRSPIPVKALARKARCTLNSHFRAAVARLVREGRLRRTADGVSLP